MDSVRKFVRLDDSSNIDDYAEMLCCLAHSGVLTPIFAHEMTMRNISNFGSNFESCLKLEE